MERTITLNDLRHYLQEINQVEKSGAVKNVKADGPSELTLQNILRYSSALDILKTRTAGIIYQLAN